MQSCMPHHISYQGFLGKYFCNSCFNHGQPCATNRCHKPATDERVMQHNCPPKLNALSQPICFRRGSTKVLHCGRGSPLASRNTLSNAHISSTDTTHINANDAAIPAPARITKMANIGCNLVSNQEKISTNRKIYGMTMAKD